MCKYPDMTEGEDACEWMKNKTEAEKETRKRIINGKLVQLYIDRAFSMVATSNNTHVCTSECNLPEIQGECFQLEQNTDLVHVHLTHPVQYCNAPIGACVHTGPKTILKGEVYVCENSGKAHMCTDKECDADTVETEAGMCCILTGNVIRVNRKLYKHDWLEDDKYCPGKSKGPTESQRAHRTKVGCTENSRILDALRQLMNDIPTGKDELETYNKAHMLLVDKATAVISVLFPGSDVRNRLESEEDLHTTKIRYANHWRYIKNCTENNKPIFIDVLDQATRQLTKCDELRNSRPRIQISGPKVQVVARGYARGTILHLKSVLKYTKYRIDSLSAYVNYVIATLYMQQHRFCIQGVDIFPGDTFLESMLPKQPNNLVYYTNGIKPTLTNTRNAVQKCIAEAITTGAALPMQLQCPHLPYADVFI